MEFKEGDNPYAAPSSPLVDVEPPSPVSVKRELREWLGLTWADLLVYLAAAAIFAMFFTRVAVLDAVLAIVALLFSLASCPLGMRRDPRVSRFTNLMKAIGYPAAVVLTLLLVLVHYVYWDGR
jgi:hypothetical protein